MSNEGSRSLTIPTASEDPVPNTGIQVYEHYYLKAVNHILKPLFFVSHLPLALNCTGGRLMPHDP